MGKREKEREASMEATENRVESTARDDKEPASKQDVDVLLKAPFTTADFEKKSSPIQPNSNSVTPSAYSSWKDQIQDDGEERGIEMAKAEMKVVMEENQRLKMCLDQIMKDYDTLKMQFREVIQRSSEGKKSTQTASGSTIYNSDDQVEEVDDMVSLTLGRFSSNTTPNQIQNKKIIISNNSQTRHHHHHHHRHLGSSLGLMSYKSGESKLNNETSSSKSKSPTNDGDHDHIQTQIPMDSSNIHEEAANFKEEEGGPGETWPPSKVLKNLRNSSGDQQDEVCQQSPPKKARVCVRARCDTPTLNDGCQWRKYGQKIAKGNPCPRAYYRCTGAPSCPVRKQVQRSVEDISILITTYEGSHNHPLPVSAMAMASTTSAAAAMLLSGSSSTSGPTGPHSQYYNQSSPASISTVNLNSSVSSSANQLHVHGGINSLYHSSINAKPFYFPNSANILSASSSLSHPTITLDLTSNPPSASSSSSSSSSPFHKITSSSTYPPKYPFSNNLDFGSSSQSSNLMMSWTANNQPPYNKNNMGMGMGMQRLQVQSNNIYQTYLQNISNNNNNNSSIPIPPPPPPVPDRIAAATKAITSDPNFQSMLVAALSSIIGGGSGSGAGASGGEAINSSLTTSTFLQTPPAPGNGCGSSLLSKMATPTSSEQGKLTYVKPATVSCSNSKSPSSSPGDREQEN